MDHCDMEVCFSTSSQVLLLCAKMICMSFREHLRTLPRETLPSLHLLFFQIRACPLKCLALTVRFSRQHPDLEPSLYFGCVASIPTQLPLQEAASFLLLSCFHQSGQHLKVATKKETRLMAELNPAHGFRGCHVGACQNYGPFLCTLILVAVLQ